MKTNYKLVAAGVFVFLSTFIFGSLLIYTFGMVSFAALFILWLRQCRHRPLGAESICGGLIFLTSAFWFALNLMVELTFAVTGGHVPVRFYLVVNATAFLFPPLIVHNWYLSSVARLRSRHGWQAAVAVIYAVSFVIIATYCLVFFRAIRFSRWMILALPFCFMVASIFGVLVSIKARKKVETVEEKRTYISHVALLFFMFLIFLPLLGLIAGWIPVALNWGRWLEIVSKSMPLVFIFVGVYFEERFIFFDIFIKQGIFFLCAMLALTGYFALTLPWAERLKTFSLPSYGVTIAPFLFAVTLLPLALSVPWLYRRLEQLLDRAWLGRNYPPGEAIKYFLAGVQTATTENQLIRQAEDRLAELFQASARIQVPADGLEQDIGSSVILDMPVRLKDEQVGRILMGPRVNKTPYFSEDAALLASLADMFSFMLSNIHMQQKKQQQEQREQELMLHASQSELKALRAQINPHFLFNALNAIAVLIHKDPIRAEETVEQLADVFRYTLTRSDKEWVRLEDEMEFVRSYLDVEQARFGSRLRVDLEIDDEVRDAKIPSMIVQTLVENAVKHGAASVRGVGEVRIRAQRRQNRIRIEVVDNGPGFQNSQSGSSAATAVPSRTGSGYGLKNVRQRLSGYFGAAAELKIDRDTRHNLTVVSIEMPAAES